jgi:hypothetical protein
VSYQKDYALKSSLLGRITSERLIEQEKTNEKLSHESRNLSTTLIWLKLRTLTLRKRWLSWRKPLGNAKMKIGR